MKDILSTIRNLQSREKVRLALGEPVQLLKVLCEGIVWTAAPGQNQKQELDKVIGCCLLYEGTSTLGVRFCFEKEERGGKKTGEEWRESETHWGCDGFRLVWDEIQRRAGYGATRGA